MQRKQLQISERKERRERAEIELTLISQREDQLNSDREDFAQQEERAVSELRSLMEQREALEHQRTKSTTAVEYSIQQARKCGEEFRELDVMFSTMESSRESLQRSVLRRNQDIADIDRQVTRISAATTDLERQVASFASEQEDALRSSAVIEDRLREVHGQRDQVLFNIRENSNKAVLQERQVGEAQQDVEAHRAKQIELNAERNHLLGSLEETQHELSDVLAELEDDVTEERLVRALNRISNRIERLGAVNLAAPEDLAQLNEEHDLIVRQVEDLEKSQQTLENAMQKIDRETLSLFEDTLNRANETMDRVFRKLFGGGTAELALTQEDPLSAGVVIRAQPPGKRSKVNQLSGGEKSMAAIAFIFAMFELNPSPVCVLDEVDAFLDGTNVDQFIQLIQEMSRDVQFLIISHNRATMQAAESLIGVTMQEAGVSRLVSVDLEAAFEVAEA